MEDKTLPEIARYMESLGIIDKGYLDELLKQEMKGFAGAICVTNRLYEGKKVAYSFNIIKDFDGDLYSVKNYKARMLNVPEITHGVFEGIDTAELEKRLAAMDWNMNILPYNGKAMAEVFFDVIELSKLADNKGVEVAEQLMVKYWVDTPVEKAIDSYLDYAKFEKILTFPVQMELNDVDGLQAYNLLSGRSVLKFTDREGLNADGYWIKEKDGALVKLPDFDLSASLRKLPFLEPLNEITGPEMVLELIMGKRVAAPLKVDGKVLPAFVETDPLNGGLAVYDMDLKRVSLTPSSSELQVGKQPKVAPQQKPVVRKFRKGKGL